MLIRKYEKNREKRLILSKNPKALFTFVTRKLKSKSICFPDYCDEFGDVINTDEKKSESIAKYFHSVFTEDNGKLPVVDYPTRRTLSSFLIMPEEVARLSKSLSDSQSLTFDGIPQSFSQMW
ncbi:hypothetical protein Y032_0541g3177 [Ancylostoma ceylanicum]|uniref:Uncharacterized protein n=1 Tax=Ancylostoma ceylanicum TaxID=53326 RepID=A0A016WQQ4_9BILA|nr:hypothetical protein Y032_0541g3177 [Ancylostoma ceylanicum]